MGRGDGPGAKLYVFSRVCAILGSGCYREMIEVVEMPLWLFARRRRELSVTDKYEQLPEGMVGGSSGVLTMRWKPRRLRSCYSQSESKGSQLVTAIELYDRGKSRSQARFRDTWKPRELRLTAKPPYQPLIFAGLNR